MRAGARGSIYRSRARFCPFSFSLIRGDHAKFQRELAPDAVTIFAPHPLDAPNVEECPRNAEKFQTDPLPTFLNRQRSLSAWVGYIYCEHPFSQEFGPGQVAPFWFIDLDATQPAR